MIKFDRPTVGFSGPRHTSGSHRDRVCRFLRDQLLQIRPRAATSGCAEGVDTIGIELAEEIGVPLLRLAIPITVNGVVPAINDALCARGVLEASRGSRWIVEYGRPGNDHGDAYLKRDDLAVARSEIMLIVPKTSAEELRSGTWATVRRSRKAGREIRFFPLDGSDPWTEPAPARLFA